MNTDRYMISHAAKTIQNQIDSYLNNLNLWANTAKATMMTYQNITGDTEKYKNWIENLDIISKNYYEISTHHNLKTNGQSVTNHNNTPIGEITEKDIDDILRETIAAEMAKKKTTTANTIVAATPNKPDDNAKFDPILADNEYERLVQHMNERRKIMQEQEQEQKNADSAPQYKSREDNLQEPKIEGINNSAPKNDSDSDIVIIEEYEEEGATSAAPDTVLDSDDKDKSAVKADAEANVEAAPMLICGDIKANVKKIQDKYKPHPLIEIQKQYPPLPPNLGPNIFDKPPEFDPKYGPLLRFSVNERNEMYAKWFKQAIMTVDAQLAKEPKSPETRDRMIREEAFRIQDRFLERMGKTKTQ
jgi:hypothetical protein